MIVGIKKELITLVQSLLAGNLLCLIYQALRVFRGLIKHRKVWISVEDLLFWTFSSFYVFYSMQVNTKGNVRWYFVLGLMCGSLGTYYFIGKILGKYIDKSNKTE